MILRALALILCLVLALPAAAMSGNTGQARFESLCSAMLMAHRPPLGLTAPAPKTRNLTGLFIAIASQNMIRVRKLAPSGVRLNDLDRKTGATPLTWAAQTGTPEIVEYLLRRGADVAKADGLNLTPLLVAARNGRTGVATVLLDWGADPNRPGPLGHLPLNEASGPKGSLEALDLLLSRGANPHTPDRRGWTPLACAAKAAKPAVAERLLKLGTHPDGCRLSAYSPLHWAATEASVPVVRLLLEHGANPQIRGQNGDLPVSWSKSAEVTALLKQAMPTL